MKKTVIVFMMILLAAILIVSCNNNTTLVVHKVTFDSDNGSDAVVKEVKDGDTVPEPSNPAKTGYNFLGWYEGETKFEFSTKITKDYSLKAKWQLQTFTVSFNVNGGTGTYENQTINYGEKVDATKVKDPTMTGYTFIGWYNGSTKFDLANDLVTGNLNLTAKWGYVVSFISNGGSSVEAQKIEPNGTATKPANPSKTSCMFNRWTTDEAGNSEYDFNSAVTGDIKLYAQWTTLTVGGTVNLGKYTADCDYTNFRNQPITWKVLEINSAGNRALVISERVLEDACEFGSSPYYYESTIRTYLNGDFIEKYSLDSAIIENVDATGETTSIGSGNDKVFLLSKTEAEKTSYFTDNTARAALNPGNSDAWWWLRSNYNESQVYAVEVAGYIDEWDCTNPTGLRPAMWINL